MNANKLITMFIIGLFAVIAYGLLPLLEQLGGR